jgi:hypothetical protein
MVQSRFSKIKTIPNVSTGKSSPSTNNFADGISTYKPNDTMKNSELRLAQDARFDRIGEYKTRIGYKKLMNPIGYTDLSTNLSGANTDTDIADVKPYTFTPASDSLIYSVQIAIKKTGNAYAVPCISLWSNDELIAETFINPKDITSELQTLEAVFMNTPNVFTSETIEVRIGTQNNNVGNYIVETAAGDILGVAVKTCTEGQVDNIFEANINGTKTVLFTQNDTLYRMDSEGDVTKIRDLPTGVQHVRFNQDLNQVRYVDGLEGPRLLNPANNWSDTAITTTDLETGVDLEIKVRDIMDGMSDNIIYLDTDTDTQAVWTYPYGYAYAKSVIYSTTVAISTTIGNTTTVGQSTMTALTSKAVSNAEVGDLMYHGSTVGKINSISGTNYTVETVDNSAEPINSYDAFNRDFRQNFPAIQTGDPLTAMFNLGGVYYFLTRRNKYQMYAQTADQWSQSQSTAQNGTFSQESVVCDLNYAYFANDTGIYRFNGMDEESLTQNTIQNVYDAIPNKESICVDLYKNRLYVYYASVDGGVNDHCLVYNINLNKWESFDSNTYISATSARQNASNRFLCGHSRIGLIMLNESEDNDYSDMGQAIAFNLETAYEHFGTTAQLKRIPKWRPEFATTDKPYTVKCGYALDYTDNVQYAFSVDLQNLNPVAEEYVWDEPSNYGVPTMPTVLSTIPQVNGEFYRCQLRYQHIAAFEPVTFRSHTVTVQTQRIR